MCILFLNGDKIKIVFDELETGLLSSTEDDYETNLVVTCTLKTNRQMRYCFGPLYIVFIVSAIYSMSIRILSQDRSKWSLPFTELTNIDTRQSPIFEIIWLQQTIAFIIATCYYLISEVLITSILAHLCVQCKIVSNRVRKSARLIHENKYHVNKCTKEFISRHVSVYLWAREIQAAFRINVLVIFGSDILIICFAAFHASLLIGAHRYLETSAEKFEFFIFESVTTLIFVKAVVLVYKRRFMAEALEKLQSGIFLPNKDRGGVEEVFLKAKCVQMMNRQAYVYWAVVTVTVIFALIDSGYSRIFNEDYHHWKFEYSKVTMFNTSYSPNYEIAMLYQNGSWFSIGWTFAISDLLTVTVLAHITCQLKILQVFIKKIIRNNYKAMAKDGLFVDERRDASQIPYKYLQKSLKEAVMYHLSVFDIANKIEDTFNVLVLVIVLSGIVLVGSLVYKLNAQFHQDIYEIDHERIDLVKINRSAVRRVDFSVVPVNHTRSKALNASGVFVTAIERNLKIKVTVYRFVANAYRVFPINVTIDGCDPNRRNIFGLRSILEHTNFVGCPIPKGYLYLKYYVLEEDKFPPHIPMGKYKLYVEVTGNDETLIGSGNWYGGIVPKSKSND
ncbi:hypothetical protein RN001_010650 [Aquatica leii]|uniref:Odorant receptor n=1 Tax=Aquatica leii TaxID=1421715 RepID=A0AAN7SG63_9COLE|nr:hypothetical protein RN001_010650 [Aquatica leii]